MAATIDNDGKLSEEVPEKVTDWKDKFQFPVGARLLVFYQLLSGMGNYCYLLSMPIYMTSMLKFSDTTSTTIVHAKAGFGTLLNILGAILADSFLGRSKTYLYIYPCGILLIGVVFVLSIYSQAEGIVITYFGIAIITGLVGPAIRAIIGDQIVKDDKIMLGTYMHIIYLINNFGVIIIAYIGPIMHKDIYCFGIECYPLVFAVACLLTGFAFTIFLVGFLMKLFVIFKPTDNLLLNIFRCVSLALKKRITLGKPSEGLTWLDYSREKFDASFIRDIKITKGLLIFLLAHPLFWTVFEQISSIWTLQAQYMDGRVTENFVIKADQMQTLNPILVVLLIPIFELFIYPLLGKIHFKVPYRIVAGQVFTAFACISMVFIQLEIDKVVNPKPFGKAEINLVNFANGDVSWKYGPATFVIPRGGIQSLVLNGTDHLIVKFDNRELNISTSKYVNKVFSTIIYQDRFSLNSSSSEIEKQINGGYANVRLFNHIDSDFGFSIFLRARVGINKDFTLTANWNQFGKYSKCGIGLFDIYLHEKEGLVKRKLGEIVLHPAETKTLIITGNQTVNMVTPLIESRLILPKIFWQIVPYVMVTIGEVLFNVNTGIFLYDEAPLSMKSMLLAAEYTCIALGNILILILKQVLGQLSTVYLFIICGVLVALSGVCTGILGYFYLASKYQHKPVKITAQDSTEL